MSSVMSVLAQLHQRIKAEEDSNVNLKKVVETHYFNHINEQFILAKNLKVGDYVNMWSLYQYGGFDPNTNNKKEYTKDWKTKHKSIFKVVDKTGEIGIYVKKVSISGKLEESFSFEDILSGSGVDNYEYELRGFELDEGYVESQILDAEFIPYASLQEKLQEERERRTVNNANKISMNNFAHIQSFAKNYSTGGVFTTAKGITFDIKPFTAPNKLESSTKNEFIDSAYNTDRGWAHKKFITGTRTNSKGQSESFAYSTRELYRGAIPTLYKQPYQKAKKGLE